MIKDWVIKHNIEVLNVAGPRESNDPEIYKATVDILQTAFYLGIIDESKLISLTPVERNDIPAGPGSLPRTVNQAVDSLISRLTFTEKSRLANQPASRLKDLRFTLGSNIQHDFEIDRQNHELLASCRDVTNDKDLAAEEAAFVILKALWAKLQNQTHLIKIVK
jgi:hypothetical protein